MKESLLQYAWQYKLFKMNSLQTTDGIPIEIIDVGHLNTDAGPDFFNAKIKIGNTIWAGNVEIHLIASDWYRHHHDTDNRYDSIILHVVGKSDLPIQRKNGETIPQLEVQLERSVQEKYNQLKMNNGWIRCSSLWQTIDTDFIKFQLSRMMNERLYRKSQFIQTILTQNRNDWSTTFYQTLFRSFGMHINAAPFELLAKSLPLKIIAKNKHNLEQTEALLLGQAGLLENINLDSYGNQLAQTYHYLQKKYDLSSIDSSLWKYAKMRPSNFPTIKIAQLAHLIHNSEHLFSKLVNCQTISSMKELMQCSTSDYWETHYRLGIISKRREKHLDETTIESLIINAIIPILFAYGEKHENIELQEKCLHFLEELPCEKNRIISGWETLGVKGTSAYGSQALIELKREYCDLNKCLRCAFGHHILSQK